MREQILRCLKSKYLLFFSARWVSRCAGIDQMLPVGEADQRITAIELSVRLNLVM
jgi:hypothetical protein